MKVWMKREAVELVLTRRNMTQRMLEIECGIAKRSVSHMMTKKRSVGPKVRSKILAALAPITFDEIFTTVGPLQASSWREQD